MGRRAEYPHGVSTRTRRRVCDDHDQVPSDRDVLWHIAKGHHRGSRPDRWSRARRRLRQPPASWWSPARPNSMTLRSWLRSRKPAIRRCVPDMRVGTKLGLYADRPCDDLRVGFAGGRAFIPADASAGGPRRPTTERNDRHRDGRAVDRTARISDQRRGSPRRRRAGRHAVLPVDRPWGHPRHRRTTPPTTRTFT